MAKKPFNRAATPAKTQAAVFPREYEIGGIRLHPLNTISYLALDKLGSPFLLGLTKIRLIDIANAMFVLSKDADELEQLMGHTDPEFRVLCAKFCRGIPPEVVLKAASIIAKMIGEGLQNFVPSGNPK